MLVDHLVLAGGGHSHALLLRRWAMCPYLRPKGLITLISRDSTTFYSAMVAGVIAGKYRVEDIQIDLRKLTNQSSVALVLAEITGLDPREKTLFIGNRPSITYTKISLDVGSETNLRKVNKFISKDLAVPIKPFKKALQWIEKQDTQLDLIGSKPLSVIGSGLAALEITFALRRRWPKRALKLQIFSEKIDKKMREFLLSENIELIRKEKVIQGPALFCTGNEFPQWLKESGLPVDPSGRVLTMSTFQSVQDPDIFAVGDCGVIENYPRPASGVWAVRASKPLARNIERSILGLDLVPWRPQRSALQLLGGPFKLNSSLGWAFWQGLRIGPHPLFWWMKKLIDRRFIEMFHHLPFMREEGNSLEENSLCRGCAAKLASQPLNIALKKAGLFSLANQPEDASVISSFMEEGSLIQSIDGFPAFISDPWLNARLTTLHACSDIWATGASVISAQTLITLPVVSTSLQEELLVQVLGGIKSVLDLQGAQLVGGHTMESRTFPPKLITLGIDIGLTVNGLLANNKKPWKKNGLQSGDVVLLSRGLGSGVLFAAAMTGNVNPIDLDLVINELNTSQHIVLEGLLEVQENKGDFNIIHACTDITGFGLLGHLSEMLLSSNSQRRRDGLRSLKIKLEADKIPSFQGVLALLGAGYASTSARENRKFWRFFDTTNDSPALFEWTCIESNLGSDDYRRLMELIVDPQTCGPLAVTCSKEIGEELVYQGPWVRIGSVKSI